MTIQRWHVVDVTARYANCLNQYGPSNLMTIRSEVARREVEDGFKAQQELRETKREMKERGIKRLSMLNGGHSTESMRYNERCFALETAILKAKQHIIP